ncbi:hypothetical protein DYU11_20390 [Fibrisoma montanum]|uniref:Uncharacterized protein n=1 Tax=Fibrisoma montanum TaxID=2305895 RepID=A0A418M3T8_9BACT|nr:hypothetical protein [Fibrisoma montanum]RIV20410.1 hypothetical protein DYU11_20390 [Fibrisoma montanum]
MEVTEETNEEFGSRMMRMLQEAKEREQIEEANSTYVCPICQQQMIFTPRYPNAVCRRCKPKTIDKKGQAVSFRNIALSGGCEGYYVDTLELYDSHECYIDGVQCWADEARFGGIVVEVVLPKPEVVLHPALTEEEINSRIDELDRWAEFVDERISEWLEELPAGLSAKLDGSISSLSVVETHLLGTYKPGDLFLPQNKRLLDAIVSYVGKTYIEHLPNADWYIELHDQEDINFGQLSVATWGLIEPISLESEISEIFKVKTGTSLQRRYDRMIGSLRRVGAI